MMQRNDLDGILDLLRRQQAALASQAPDAVDRLDSIHAELQKQLLRLSDNNRRALETIFKTQPLVYTR